MKREKYRLFNNSRFYILTSAVLISVIVATGFRSFITSDQLFYIRIQQVFGALAVSCLYFAVLLTPLSKVLSKRPWLQRLLFARRAIGVAAAYFTLLHILVVLLKQTGGISGLLLLPVRFKQAFVLGSGGALILFIMAATSFDKVIEKMTFPRWKALHRLVYLAGVLVIGHVWMIGTHANKKPVEIIGFVALTLLFALESIRLGRKLDANYQLGRGYRLGTMAIIFFYMILALLLLPLSNSNYHSQHHEQTSEVQQ